MKNAKNVTNSQKNDKATSTMTIAKEQPKAEPQALNAKQIEEATEEAKAEARAEIDKMNPIGEQVTKFVESIKPVASAEERIKRVKNFEILSTRFDFLKRKSDDLKRFQMENAGTNAKLVLKNQSGFEFEVSNSSVIQKALFVVAEELKILLNDTENEVLTYEI